MGFYEFFLGYICNCLLHNCEDLFHFYSLSAVYSYDLYHIHLTSLFIFVVVFVVVVIKSYIQTDGQTDRQTGRQADTR